MAELVDRFLESQKFLLKVLHTDLLRLNSSEFSSGEAASKAPGMHVEEQGCLASGQELEGQLCPRQKG